MSLPGLTVPSRIARLGHPILRLPRVRQAVGVLDLVAAIREAQPSGADPGRAGT